MGSGARCNPEWNSQFWTLIAILCTGLNPSRFEKERGPNKIQILAKLVPNIFQDGYVAQVWEALLELFMLLQIPSTSAIGLYCSTFAAYKLLACHPCTCKLSIARHDLNGMHFCLVRHPVSMHGIGWHGVVVSVGQVWSHAAHVLCVADVCGGGN